MDLEDWGKENRGRSAVDGGSYHDVVTKLQAFAQSATGPFARPGWFGLLARHDERSPIVHANDRAAWVLTRDGDVIRALTNWYSFTWHPFGDREAWADLAARLNRHTARVALSPLADEDGTATALLAAFRSAGWAASLQPCDINHVLDLNGADYARYLADRPGRLRTTLKRKSKKVECRITTSFEEDMWNTYGEVYNASWKPEEGNPALLRAFAEQEGKAGRLRLAVASHQGTPVAAQFWTVENGVAYIHKLAHLEAAQPLSAGTVLSAALFEWVIDRDGVGQVDFGTGNDAYKADWMNGIRARYRLLAFDPKQPKAWLPMLRHSLGRLRARLASGGSRG